MYSNGPLYMDEQRQDNQLEPTNNGSVPIRYVTLKTCRKQWPTVKGGEKGSGISLLMMNWYTSKNPQSIAKPIGILRNKRTSGYHPVYSIIKISQNTEESPGDSKRFAVTQPPMRNHQLTLVRKTHK